MIWKKMKLENEKTGKNLNKSLKIILLNLDTCFKTQRLEWPNNKIININSLD